MDQDFSINKTTVECYKIRHKSGMYWADITVDNGEQTSGRIQIASDYGDWQYYWGACGTSFKRFLITIGLDYVAGKFREDRYIDTDKTIRMYKEHVLESRRFESISAELARTLYEETKLLDDVTENGFEQHLHVMCSNLLAEFDHCPEVCHRISPMFQQFWDKIWPVFINELKNELEYANL